MWQITNSLEPDLRRRLGHPAMIVAITSGALLLTALFSRGLATTRTLLTVRNSPQADLLLVCEKGIMLGELLPISPALRQYWAAHARSFETMAGYRWDSSGVAFFTPELPALTGGSPNQFLLHRTRSWQPLPANSRQPLGAVGRLKPGMTIDGAMHELKEMAWDFREHRQRYPYPEPVARTLADRMEEPLKHFSRIAAVTSGFLLAVALAVIARTRCFSVRYWLFYACKAVLGPWLACLIVWEFTPATAFSIPGSAVGWEPIIIWLYLVFAGLYSYWCLLDQHGRCRYCLRPLEQPVRIGSPGAILFDHAGVESLCCQGHGVLYDPELSSDYVQPGGWTSTNW